MTQKINHPIRVLHVVHQLNRGGVETWLLEVLNRIDRREIAIDVLVHTDAPGELDDAVRACGASILPCLQPTRPWRYMRNFKRIVREQGPYDIVHCHLHSWCGMVARLAERAGIPGRISHAQNDLRGVIRHHRAPGRAYHALMRRWVRRYTTKGLAVSDHAACSLFGEDWSSAPLPVCMLPDAIDLDESHVSVDSQALRASLGLSADALVVGHVGRFSPQKNHHFLVESFAHIAEREPRARLLLVGDGPLQPAVREQVANLGLDNRVVFAGSRRDVADLYHGAIDVVLLPSHHEGLPRVALEAQAAGRPIVLSTPISRHSEVVPELVRWLSLEEEPERWAELTLELLHASPLLSPDQARQRMRGSVVDIEQNVRTLQRIYETLASGEASSDGAAP